MQMCTPFYSRLFIHDKYNSNLLYLLQATGGQGKPGGENYDWWALLFLGFGLGLGFSWKILRRV